jgi:hypothetical protein
MKTNDAWKDNCDHGDNKELLKQHCNQLMEHFDSVLTLVTKHNSKNNATTFDWNGTGNCYAHAGVVRAWLAYDNELSRAHARGDKERED